MNVILFLDPKTLDTIIVAFSGIRDYNIMAQEERIIGEAKEYLEEVKGQKILEYVWVAEDRRLDIKTDKGECSMGYAHTDYIKHKRVIMDEPSESFP